VSAIDAHNGGVHLLGAIDAHHGAVGVHLVLPFLNSKTNKF
jgi:hypothetical protein